MKLTIIPEDKCVIIDGNPQNGIDMSWVPEIELENGTSASVHVVQWYGNYGQIELEGSYDNIKINELGIFEKAIELHQQKTKEIEYAIEQETIALNNWLYDNRTYIKEDPMWFLENEEWYLEYLQKYPELSPWYPDLSPLSNNN